MEELQAPGLRWRVTKGRSTPIWRASKAAVKAGYPVKSANLAPFADDGACWGSAATAYRRK